MNFILIPLLTMATLTLHIQEKIRNTDGKEQILLATCSAVMISENEALTAEHCVHTSTGKLWALDSNNRSFTAIIERVDKVNDICLIKLVSPIPHTYVNIGHMVNKGDRIYTVNSGDDFIGTFGEGMVANIIKDPQTDTVSIIHTSPILPGASGSGLFNWRGQLVGINTAMYKNLSNAVDITEIEYFLKGKLR